MVKISSFVLTVVLFATSAFSVAIPAHVHKHHALDTITTGGSQIQSSQNLLAAREPGWLSIGKKLVKEGAHVAKSRKGRKVMKKAAKGAFAVVENL